MEKYIYDSRLEAGFELARELKEYKGKNAVILAVPRGAIPIGYVVAKELQLPMEIIYSKKIGHPSNKEYAIGAVSLHGSYLDPHENISPLYVKTETARIRGRLLEMRRKFTGDTTPIELRGKTVIVIDDGIATGNTMLATIKIIKKNSPAAIVLAVPVAPAAALERLSGEVDKIICPLVPDVFYGVGAFYKDFEQVTDEEVIYYLEKIRHEAIVVKK